MSIKTEISVGELLDKITILRIKQERIEDPTKLKNIEKELEVLQTQWQSSQYSETDLQKSIDDLKKVNESLWEIEDKIRLKENNNKFDDEFVQLARSVYFTNDKRAEIKREINDKTGSGLVEEKSYCDYTDNK